MKKYTLPTLFVILLFLSCRTYQASGANKTKEVLQKPQEISSLISKAKQGDAKAQYNLGVMYANGLGVKQDYTNALELFTKSAEQGDADAKAALEVARKKMD